MIQPTRLRVLAGAAVGAAVVAGTLLTVADGAYGPATLIPWSVPVAIALLAVGVLVSAVVLRRRLKGGPGVRPVNPLGAARMVAVAKASALAGALLTGQYAAVALVLLPEASVVPVRRVVIAALSALASLGLSAAGLFLERVCRIDPPGEDPVT